MAVGNKIAGLFRFDVKRTGKNIDDLMPVVFMRIKGDFFTAGYLCQDFVFGKTLY